MRLERNVIAAPSRGRWRVESIAGVLQDGLHLPPAGSRKRRERTLPCLSFLRLELTHQPILDVPHRLENFPGIRLRVLQDYVPRHIVLLLFPRGLCGSSPPADGDRAAVAASGAT